MPRKGQRSKRLRQTGSAKKGGRAILTKGSNTSKPRRPTKKKMKVRKQD